MRQFAIFLLLSVSLFLDAQGTHQSVAEGWKRLTLQEKILYMNGYRQGFEAGAQRMEVQQNLKHGVKTTGWTLLPDSPVGISEETLVSGVDKCYEDFRNAEIASQYCVDWAVKGIHGVSDADREDYLTFVRRSIASNPK